MNRWYTADTHFGHRKVIEYCQRPFSSVEEMDATMIKNWNDKVQPEDRNFLIIWFCMFLTMVVLPELILRIWK